MCQPLSNIMQYTNPHVIARYTQDYPNHTLCAEEAFQEVLKFLWLCYQHQKEKNQCPEDESLQFVCAIHFEMSEIDDMWHTFILFTQDYMTFCHDYFGQYMHHLPATEEDEESSDEVFEGDLTKYLLYIHKKLGHETLKTWFYALLHD